MPHKDRQQRQEYQKNWLRKRRQSWFDENGPCVICGSTNRLELDHIDPTTKISHRVWSWSEERRLKELAKCRVLCYNCHKDKSRSEVQKGVDRYNAKLTEQDILSIRREYQKGVRGRGYRSLADKYGVDRKMIDRIINGHKWKHI